MKIPNVKTIPEYTKFKGGIDAETPPLSLAPGALLDGFNYEVGTEGGYSLIDGYERKDGRTAPSDGIYYYLQVTLTDTVSVGDTITGVTSGETGIVVVAGTAFLDISKVSGDFQIEEITVSGSSVGNITAIPEENGEPLTLGHATAKNATADLYRADITKPTGSGPIRGVGLLSGTVYCFRDNAGATAGLIYKETTSGWSGITLYHELSFDTGVGQIYDGDSITQLTSGATADVKRVVQKAGAWGSTAAGKLILDNITGTFNDTNDIQVASATKVTSTSLAVQITIDPGGRYETIEYNFTGSTDTKRMYGADGVNRGFEFDGDVYVPLDTKMATDTPEYVFAHKRQLFFSFGGSSQNSGVGSPYEWTAISGASDIALGDNITGYLQLPGAALAIFARNLSQQLIGNDVDDYVLDFISDEIGCIPRTAQDIGYAFILDDRGIVQIKSTLNYGKFSQNVVSKRVQSIIDKIRKVVVASSVYRARDQYRLYGSDGTGLSMTIMDKGVGFSRFEYPDNVACTVTGEDATGKDVIYFGSDEGMVYQADKGSSFDGENIEAYIMLPFNNSKSPTTRKTYRRATIEMTSENYSPLRFMPDFSYADPNIPQHTGQSINVDGGGGFWNVNNWDEFSYDKAYVESPSFRICGVGTNLGLVIYSDTDIDLGHKLDSAIIHYTIRRLQR